MLKRLEGRSWYGHTGRNECLNSTDRNLPILTWNSN